MSHHKNQEQEILDTQQDTELQEHGEQRLELTESIGTTGQLGQPCEISVVLIKDVPDVWEEVYPIIDRCQRYANGELYTQDYLEMILDGNIQLWVASDKEKIFAAMLTEFIAYPRKKVLRIIAIAGNRMESWMEFFPALEAAALGVGCTGLEAQGRKGWLRVLKDWECSYHVLTKDIKNRLQ